MAGLPTGLQPALGMADVLALPIRQDEATARELEAIVGSYRTSDHQGALEAELDKLGAVVGAALGLSEQEIALIKSDMPTDPHSCVGCGPAAQ
jgi:hypothetical protein